MQIVPSFGVLHQQPHCLTAGDRTHLLKSGLLSTHGMPNDVRNLLTTLTVIAGLSAPFVATAEILKLNTGAVVVRQNANMPTRGMDKLAVETEFGAPVKKNPTIGKPAISSWDYADFTTYFEGTLVLHSVLHSTRQNH